MKTFWTIILILLGIIVVWLVLKPGYTPTPSTYDMPEGYDEFQSNNPGGDVY